MPLEGGLEELKNKPSSTFDRQLQEWGVRMPDISVGDFLRNTCGITEINDYWNGKKMDKFCLDVVHERNNGQKEKKSSSGIYETPINPDRRKELYEALKKYTNDKIATFKNKEEHKEKFAITTEALIKEKNEILPFVRAREALKDKKVINYEEAAKEQKIRDGKTLIGLTEKTKSNSVL